MCCYRLICLMAPKGTQISSLKGHCFHSNFSDSSSVGRGWSHIFLQFSYHLTWNLLVVSVTLLMRAQCRSKITQKPNDYDGICLMDQNNYLSLYFDCCCVYAVLNLVTLIVQM